LGFDFDDDYVFYGVAIVPIRRALEIEISAGFTNINITSDLVVVATFDPGIIVPGIHGSLVSCESWWF